MSRFLFAGQNILAPIFTILLPASLLCGGSAQADTYRIVERNGTPVFINTQPTGGGRQFYLKGKPTTVGAQPALDPRRFAVGSDSLYAGHIQAAATANNIDAALIRAVISAESAYNPYAVSRAGAVGLMQLMPQTASRYHVKDLRNPEQNIHGGARYLRDLMNMFNNDVRLAIAAYNAGEQAVVKHGNRIPPYRETSAYVPKVLRYYERYRNGYASPHEYPGYQRVVAIGRRGVSSRPVVMYLSNAPQ